MSLQGRGRGQVRGGQSGGPWWGEPKAHTSVTAWLLALCLWSNQTTFLLYPMRRRPERAWGCSESQSAERLKLELPGQSLPAATAATNPALEGCLVHSTCYLNVAYVYGAFLPSLHGSGWNALPGQSCPSFRNSIWQSPTVRPSLILQYQGFLGFQHRLGNSAESRFLYLTPRDSTEVCSVAQEPVPRWHPCVTC